MIEKVKTINLQYAVNKFNDFSSIFGPKSQYYRFESEHKDSHLWDLFVSYIESDSIDSFETAQRVIDCHIEDRIMSKLKCDKERFFKYLDNRGEEFEVELSDWVDL